MVTGELLVSDRQLLQAWWMSTARDAYANAIMQIDDSEHPQKYGQTFQLLPDGQGSYYVLNDVFRLIYG